MALKVFNTLSGKKEDFEPLAPPKVGMYCCGITAYDTCHLGHARAAVVFDTVYRYLKRSGYNVTYVRNYTDVDDKIISGRTRKGAPAPRSPSSISRSTRRIWPPSASPIPTSNRRPRST